MKTTARLTIAALTLAGAMILGGCATLSDVFGSSEPDRDEDTGQVTEGDDAADVFALRVGDCLNTAELSGEISEVPIIPCDEPHDSEVFHSQDLADGDFPGDDEVSSQAESACLEQFASFVGLSYDESALNLFPMYPTEASWDGGDREILCIVSDPEGNVTGSLEGAAR